MRALAISFAVATLVALGGFYSVWGRLETALLTPLDPGSDVSKTIQVEPSDDVRAVWRTLADAGLARDDPILDAFFAYFAEPRTFRGGEIEVSPRESLKQQLARIQQGDVITYTLSVPAGASTEAIADLFARERLVERKALLGAVRSPAVARRLGVDADTLDGFLFPDVYAFPRSVTSTAAVEAMVSRFLSSAPEGLWAEAEARGKNKASLVALAALIEAGPVAPENWRLLSAMLIARKERGLSLEASKRPPRGPWGVYGPEKAQDPGWPRPARNPGVEALEAALQPAPGSPLHLFIRPDGAAVFAVDAEGFREAMGTGPRRTLIPQVVR